MSAAAETSLLENEDSGQPSTGSAFSSRIPYSADPEQAAEDRLTPSDPHNSANVCGGDPLGSPPHKADTGLSALPVSRTQPEGGRGPRIVASTPEQIAAAKAFYADWTANETEGQKMHAKGRSTVFSLMQYREHGDTGTLLWTREQWDELIAALEEADVLDRHAAIWHDLDTLPDKSLKALHFHGVIRLRPGHEKQVRFLSIRASMPASRVQTPRDAYAEGKVATGPLAADLAFFDFCEYLVHEDERSRKEKKHLYGRDEVIANFDFSEFLDAGRPAKAKGRGASAMTTRIAALRRAVGDEGMTLDEAEKLDIDACFADLPRLEKLRSRYLAKPENQPKVGSGGVYRKASLGIFGPSRAGKDELAVEISQRLVALAALAGQTWEIVKPSGEHSTEDVGTAEIAHHEDARFQFTRSYDDALRYADANQAAKQAGRGSNLAPVAPRAILLTTSETLGSFALSLKARKASDELAMSFDKYPAINVDEFLFRLGWVVEVTKPSWIGLRDLVNTRKEMMVSISRVETEHDARIEVVSNRDGEDVGRIRTKHRLDPVAIIKGCENAARFLAMSIIEEYSPDVAAAIPDMLVEFASERLAIGQGVPLAHEQRALDALAMRQGLDRPEVTAHFRDAHLDGLDTPDPETFPIHFDGTRHWCGAHSSAVFLD